MQIGFHMDALKKNSTGALPPNPLRALRLAPLAGRSREEAARNCTDAHLHAHLQCVAQRACKETHGWMLTTERGCGGAAPAKK